MAIEGPGECIEKCEAVSEKIGEFSDKCIELEAAEEAAIALSPDATCVVTAAAASAAHTVDTDACAAVTGDALLTVAACEAVMKSDPALITNETACTYIPKAVKTFECHTLRTLPAIDGGCAAPWCTIKATSASGGICATEYEPGQDCGIWDQGWERNCEHLCTAASPASVRLDLKT